MSEYFTPNEDGTHDWVTVPTNHYKGSGDNIVAIPDTMHFVRVTSGWDEREVCHIGVNTNVLGERYISLQGEYKLKTKDSYKHGGLSFQNAEQYGEFLAQIIEAGRRAGFIGGQHD